MRGMLLGLAIAMAAGAAHAGDLIVVSSTDPAIARGAELQSGTKVALAPGKTLVLIDTAGQVVRVSGSANGVVLPRRQIAANDERLAVMKLLVAQPRIRRGRSQTAARALHAPRRAETSASKASRERRSSVLQFQCAFRRRSAHRLRHCAL